MCRAATLLLLAICCVACNNPLGVVFAPEEACAGQTTDVRVTANDASRGQTVYVTALTPPGVEVVVDAGTPSADFARTDKLAGGKYYEVPADGLVVHVTAEPGTEGETVVFQSVWAFDGVPAEHTVLGNKLPIVECIEEPEPGEGPGEPFFLRASVSPDAVPCDAESQVVVQGETGGGVPSDFDFGNELYVHVEADAGVEAAPIGDPETKSRTEARLGDLEEAPEGTYYHVGTTYGGAVELPFVVRADSCVEQVRYVTFRVFDTGVGVFDPSLVDTLRVAVQPGSPGGDGAELHVTTFPGGSDPADACAHELDQFGMGHGQYVNVAGGPASFSTWDVTLEDWRTDVPGFIHGTTQDPLSVTVVDGDAGDVLVASNGGNWWTVALHAGSTAWEQARIFSGAAQNIEGAPDGSGLVTWRFGLERVTVDESTGDFEINGEFDPGAAPDQFGKVFGGACQIDGNVYFSFWRRSQDGTCTWATHDKSDTSLYALLDAETMTCDPTRTECVGDFACTTDTAGDQAFFCDYADPENLTVTPRAVPDSPRDCCAVRDAAGDYFWYFSTEGGVYCICHDSSGDVKDEGYLDLPAGTSSEFCTAQIYPDGKFVLYYDLLNTDQCGFVVAGAPVSPTSTITVK